MHGQMGPNKRVLQQTYWQLSIRSIAPPSDTTNLIVARHSLIITVPTNKTIQLRATSHDLNTHMYSNKQKLHYVQCVSGSPPDGSKGGSIRHHTKS